MNKRILTAIVGALLCVASPSFAQDTVFYTGFDYSDIPIVIEPGDLNGARQQVGSWSGDEFSEGTGDILELPDSVGIIPSPYGDNLMLLDRPGGDPDRPNAEPNTDFTGSYFADFSDPILLLGAQVSFQVGTRRTGGNNNKDYDVVGRDSNGEEAFRLRIGTNNNGGDRLGYVAGGSAVFDLPTVSGEDGPDDLDNTGGFTALDGPGFNAEIANVVLSLGAESFTVDFSYPEEGTSGNKNAYTTSALPYNGSAVDLAQLEFTYEASPAGGRNSGYMLDEIRVTGFEEILQGDFDFNGKIEFADFLAIANNFGTASAQGDFDFDGDVDLHDWVGFKAAYDAANAPAGAAAVPEPSSLTLLCLASLVALIGRRRR